MLLNELLIAPIALLVVLMAVLVPVSFLLYADLASVMIPGFWEPAGIMVGPSDLIVTGLLVAALLRVRNRRPLPMRPLVLWAILVTLMGVSYLAAPVHSQYFDGPAQVVYQLLRYVLKAFMYLPLVLVLFRSENRLRHLTIAVVAVGVMIAFQACLQGYSGASARGPFAGKNMLGGSLVTPLLLSLYWMVRGSTWRVTALAGGSAILIARAMVFVGSRGGFVGLFAGLVFLAVVLFRHSTIRSRTLRLVPVACLLLALLVMAKPDILQRDSTRAITSIGEGTDEANFRWRFEERWPHFWKIALEHPWLGIGTHTDESLGTQANTPHSGYLAGAVEYGFPASIVLFALGLGAVARCRKLVARTVDEDMRALSAFVGAALVGIFVHLVVEATIFQSEFMMNVYMLLIGMSLALEDLLRASNEESVLSSKNEGLPRNTPVLVPAKRRQRPAARVADA